MRPDPEPIIGIPFKDGQGTVVAPDPSAPDFAYFLEPNRRVSGITLPKDSFFEPDSEHQEEADGKLPTTIEAFNL
jgi:hypothetical protein